MCLLLEVLEWLAWGYLTMTRPHQPLFPASPQECGQQRQEGKPASFQAIHTPHSPKTYPSPSGVQERGKGGYALVLSTENITQNWYRGNERSMLLPNTIFRMGELQWVCFCFCGESVVLAKIHRYQYASFRMGELQWVCFCFCGRLLLCQELNSLGKEKLHTGMHTSILHPHAAVLLRCEQWRPSHEFCILPCPLLHLFHCPMRRVCCHPAEQQAQRAAEGQVLAGARGQGAPGCGRHGLQVGHKWAI